MIRNIRVTNYRGESMDIDIFNPDSSGYYIKDIDGLGPVAADVLSNQISTSDGIIVNGVRRSERVIIMTLGFWTNSGYTVEELRHKIYKYFIDKKETTLTITTDERKLAVTGIVNQNEIEFFSEECSCAISLVCADPNMYSVDGKDGMYEHKFSGIEPRFHFPFNNPSLDQKRIVFGEIVDLKERNIIYNGDEDLGIVLSIHAIGPCRNITIYNILPGNKYCYFGIDHEKLSALTGSGIIQGDTITVDTRTRYKTIKLLRDGVEYNIINAMVIGSTWFTLSKGDNLFTYDAEDGFENIIFTLKHKLAYSGI